MKMFRFGAHLLPKPSASGLLAKRFGLSGQGGVAVLLALLLPVLIGGLALAIDLSRAWNLDTQLQNAADAAALAGATQLDRNVDARARAIQAATGALVPNRQTLATDGLGLAVSIDTNIVPDDNLDIKFYETIDNPVTLTRAVLATTDATAQFIEVHVQSREVGFFFAAIVGAVSSAHPDAFAVAGLTEALCNVPPMMICNPFQDGSTTHDPDVDFAAAPWNDMVGRAVVLDVGGSSGSWTPGNFGLLSVKEPGASALREAFAAVNPDAVCFGTEVETKTGQVTSIRAGLNVRFDIFSGTFSNGEELDANYVPARNTVKGLIKTGSKCTVSNGGWEKGLDPYTGPTVVSTPIGPAPKPQVMGLPRDKCQYAGSCTAPTPTGTVNNPRFGDGDWDVETYITVNHPAFLTASGSMPNAVEAIMAAFPPLLPVTDQRTVDGYAGGTSLPTRYDVHRWESSLPANLSDPENLELQPQQCNVETPDPNPPSPNRRMLPVAVVNCGAKIHDCDSHNPADPECEVVKGNTDQVKLTEPDAFIAMFLTEPMGVYDTNNDLVGEVVGPISDTTLFNLKSKKIVQLYPVPQ